MTIAAMFHKQTVLHHQLIATFTFVCFITLQPSISKSKTTPPPSSQIGMRMRGQQFGKQISPQLVSLQTKTFCTRVIYVGLSLYFCYHPITCLKAVFLPFHVFDTVSQSFASFWAFTFKHQSQWRFYVLGWLELVLISLLQNYLEMTWTTNTTANILYL